MSLSRLRPMKATGRSRHGNMLALIAAVALVVAALAIFGIGLVRLIGSSSEQKTAIEAAAIAAASDMSRMVVFTPQYGYVGLSDAAPIGSLTKVSDDFGTPVYGINTLIGTARLDYLIASQPGLDLPEWRELAKKDLEDTKAAAQQLKTAMENAIKPGGSGLDKDNKKVEPYASAESAYKLNQIRMTGSSDYVAGSLKLELGMMAGALTNTPVPSPAGSDSTLDSSNTVGQFYRAYVNVPVGSENFVFAGIGDSIKIVDNKSWVKTLPGMPDDFEPLPTIIRAEAVQSLSGTHGKSDVVASACAQPANVYDPKPAPGALTISFPDGVPDGPQKLEKPSDLYGEFLSEPEDSSDFYSATPGDFPVTSGSKIAPATWPLSSDSRQLASSACKIAVYDWLRRAGTKANVDSIVGMHHTPFVSQGPDVDWPPDTKVGKIPRGIVHIYKFDTDGVIYYEVDEIKPSPWWVVSDRQQLVECFDAITDGAPAFTVQPVKLQIVPTVTIPLGKVEFTPRYDMYVRIYSRNPGKPGGRHGGEPMDNDLVSFGPIDSLGHGRLIGKLSFSGSGAKQRQPMPIGIGVGVGSIPTLMPQEDFAFEWKLLTATGPTIDNKPSLYEKFDYSGPGVRTTYDTDGSVADIRFRRVVIGKDPVSTVINVAGSLLPIQKQQGYVGEK